MHRLGDEAPIADRGTSATRMFRVLRLALPALALLALFASASSAVAAPSWLAPTRLSEAASNADVAGVAVDGAGDAVAVWKRGRASLNVVEAATHPVGGSWSAPVKLSDGAQNAESPRVAISPAGDAVAVWNRSDGTNFIIEAATHPAGGSWSVPSKLSAAGQSAGSPQVAVDANGDAVAIWRRNNGAINAIEAATHPTGGAWSAPTKISNPARNSDNPRVAVDPAGNAVAAWNGSDGVKLIVEAAALAINGSWSTPVALSDEKAGSDLGGLAIGPAGEAIAVWNRVNGADFDVEAATHPAGGAWSPPSRVTEGGKAFDAAIAIDRGGNAVAAWDRSNGTREVVEAATRPRGGAWSAPSKVSNQSQDATFPKVATDGSGNAVLVWERIEERGEEEDNFVEAATHPFGGSWSAPSLLSGQSQNRRELPELAADSAGDAVAVWSRADATSSTEAVEAAPFDATAPVITGSSIPATGTAGVPLSFATTATDVWSPVSARWSFGDGGASAGLSVGHTFAKPGTYQVGLQVLDQAGNATTRTQAITIAAAPPTAKQKPNPIGHGKATVAGRIEVVKGKALLRLSCGAAASCSGSVKLIAKQAAKGAKRGAKKLLLAHGNIKLAAGTHRIAKLKLSAKAKRLIAASGRRGLRASLSGSGVRARKVKLAVRPSSA